MPKITRLISNKISPSLPGPVFLHNASKGIKLINNGFRLLRTCVSCPPAQYYAFIVNLIFVTTLEDRHSPFYKCLTIGPICLRSQCKEMAKAGRHMYLHQPDPTSHAFPPPGITSSLIKRNQNTFASMNPEWQETMK